MDKQKEPPIEKIKVGSVQASIWEHQGPKGNFVSTTFSRSISKDGEFKNVHDFHGQHLDDLQRAAKEAKEFENAYKMQKGIGQDSEAMKRFEARNQQDYGQQNQGHER